MVPENDVFTDTEIILMVLGFNHYRLADGTGMAGVVFGMVGLMNEMHRMHGERLTPTNVGGWPDSEMRRYLNESIFPALGHRGGWKSFC